jgi:hypothetical protein
LKASEVLSGTPNQATGACHTKPEGLLAVQERVLYAIYPVALAVSISIWLLAIRAPLWLDETVSFFVIKGRFSEILSRQGWPGVPAYPCLLWLWAKAAGTSEIALRISSLLAMLGAVYLLYCAARELFDREAAVIGAIVFCLHPIVSSESIDVRPYAFAALAITGSILVLVRLRHSNSNWLAALFGFLAACIVYFQFLFIVILPALAACFFARKVGGRKTFWRQAGVALVVFAVAFLPVIPGLHYMFHTSSTHVFEDPPTLAEFARVLAQKPAAVILAITFLIAAATRRLDLRRPLEYWPVFLCLSLALVPILILYGVSAQTSIHVFVYRYRLVAVPGVALCWALAVSRIHSRGLRLLFSLTLVAATAYPSFISPNSRFHNYTWKYALEVAERNAATDGAPVLICSDLPESNHMPMPAGAAVKDSAIFAPLSYYELSVPVVGLPRSLNDEAIQIGSQFLQQAAQRRGRFLALAYEPSYPTLEWLADNAGDTYSVNELGTFDRIKVLEFVPRIQGVPCDERNRHHG